jgi:hypothetical protein
MTNQEIVWRLGRAVETVEPILDLIRRKYWVYAKAEAKAFTLVDVDWILRRFSNGMEENCGG